MKKMRKIYKCRNCGMTMEEQEVKKIFAKNSINIYEHMYCCAYCDSFDLEITFNEDEIYEDEF